MATRAFPLSRGPSPVRRTSSRLALVGVLLVVALLGAAGFVVWRRVVVSARAASAQSSPGAAPAGKDSAGAESFHLSLNSNPVQSDVEWNGTSLGQTPLMLDLDPGSHVFVLKSEGFLPATLVVTVTAHMSGKTESRNVPMVPVAKDKRGAGRPFVAQSAPRAKVASTALSSAGALSRESSEAPSSEAPSTDETTPSTTLTSALAAPAPSASPAPAGPAPTETVVGASTATVLPYGPDMSQPKLLSSVDPVFPREAIVARVEGTVIAKCTITTSGSLENCRIIRGLPFMDKPMLDALSQRRYTPVIYRGSPVAVQYVFSTHIVHP
jgi:serine/threonine-protein kinase